MGAEKFPQLAVKHLGAEPFVLEDLANQPYADLADEVYQMTFGYVPLVYYVWDVLDFIKQRDDQVITKGILVDIKPQIHQVMFQGLVNHLGLSEEDCQCLYLIGSVREVDYGVINVLSRQMPEISENMITVVAQGKEKKWLSFQSGYGWQFPKVFRQIVKEHLFVNEPETFNQIHQAAAKYYKDNMAHADDTASMIVSYIYHANNLIRVGEVIDIDKVWLKITQTYQEKGLDEERYLVTLDRIKEMILHDRELMLDPTISREVLTDNILKRIEAIIE